MYYILGVKFMLKSLLFVCLFFSQLALAQDPTAMVPAEEIVLIAKDGKFKEEINCLAAFENNAQRELGAFPFSGNYAKLSGFYALTNKDVHFFSIDKAAHKDCFESAKKSGSQDSDRKDNFNYEVKISGQNPYYVEYNLPDQDGYVELEVKESMRTQNTCTLTNHEVTNEESVADLHEELATRISKAKMNFEREMEQHLRQRNGYKRSEFPPGKAGDEAFRTAIRSSAVKKEIRLPNPQNFINKIQACAGVKNPRVQKEITKQLAAFKVNSGSPGASSSPSAPKSTDK